MATKKAASKELALAKREPDTYKAIVAIADLAGPFSTEVNVTYENIDKSVEVLARVREANRKLDALFDAEVEAHKKAIKAVEAERNALRGRLTKADDAVAERIIALYRTVSDRDALAKRMEGAMGSSATIAHRSVTVVVEDASKVPDKYVRAVPSRAERVDTKAIAAAVAAGETVPGVKIDPNYYLTTRASEIVK